MGAPKIQANASKWMKKKNIQKCLDNSVDFQMAYSM